MTYMGVTSWISSSYQILSSLHDLQLLLLYLDASFLLPQGCFNLSYLYFYYVIQQLSLATNNMMYVG